MSGEPSEANAPAVTTTESGQTQPVMSAETRRKLIGSMLATSWIAVAMPHLAPFIMYRNYKIITDKRGEILGLIHEKTGEKIDSSSPKWAEVSAWWAKIGAMGVREKIVQMIKSRKGADENAPIDNGPVPLYGEVTKTKVTRFHAPKAPYHFLRVALIIVLVMIVTILLSKIGQMNFPQYTPAPMLWLADAATMVVMYFVGKITG